EAGPSHCGLKTALLPLAATWLTCQSGRKSEAGRSRLASAALAAAAEPLASIATGGANLTVPAKAGSMAGWGCIATLKVTPSGGVVLPTLAVGRPQPARSSADRLARAVSIKRDIA